jgi:HAD superfamily hydrolase (TIGR01509 family)
MTTVAFRAILFDFDGVLADTERLHAESFRQVLETVTQPFSSEEYFGRYIHFDDLNVFLNVSRDRNLDWRPQHVERLAEKKRELFARLMRDPHLLFPGVSDLVPRLAARYPLAICSMGRRDEIEPVLNDAGLRRLFSALVTADDVEKPKPDPEVYLRGLELLNGSRGLSIRPDECLVVEDSCGGTRSGKAAGMKVVALTHSLTEAELRNAGADFVLAGIPSLTELLMPSAGSV